MSETEQDGSCAFVAIEELTPTLYDISKTKLDNDTERITTFIKTLLEYSGMKYYSAENFMVETLTFILLMCEIDVKSKFQLFMYQLHNDYVPWGFEDPLHMDAGLLNFTDVFESLINILLRLDVNRKVLQCYHCRSKCSCEVVATYSDSELNLFALQDPIDQVVETIADQQRTPDTNVIIQHISHPITMLSHSFIIDIPEFKFFSQNDNSMLNDSEFVKRKRCDTEEATLLVYHNPNVVNPHVWKGHNDDGIPIINFDAMFGHTDIDLDLQLDCKV